MHQHPNPAGANLSNWRLTPHSRWAFQNVRELIPCAVVKAGTRSMPFPTSIVDPVNRIDFSDIGIDHLPDFLEQCHTDSILVVARGRKVWQWSAAHFDPSKPHIVFSISKSITAMLAGFLVDQNLLDISKTLYYYLPGTKGGAYQDSTVQQLLDMTVAVDFDESYLDSSGDYQRYRKATGWNPDDHVNPGPAMEEYLYSLARLSAQHGQTFRYRSPNSDLLGLLIERVAGLPYAQLLSTLIWQPMAAQTNGYITVDRNGLARAAGGICVTIDDLARFGNLVLNNGVVEGMTVIPPSWVENTFNTGNRKAWLSGEFSQLLPEGCYHNQWYQVGNRDRCYMAIGIHGQWLYINPSTSVVIAKVSSQPEPVNDPLDERLLKLMSKISHEL